MKKITFIGALLFTLISLSFTTPFGLDKYEIYLNNKLVLKQFVNQPLNLRVLQLDNAKESDQLQIVYSHCRKDNGPGTGRIVALKDEQGATLLKWTFADATGADLKMAIPVKELIHWQRKRAGHELSLYYSANELPKSEMLSMVRFK
jgi:hypothetical protein